MHTQFALDLKVARRKSGLTQQDCAHLLDVHPSRISKLESGQRVPTISEICKLSLIYGKSFESLFGSVFSDARVSIREHLTTLPDCPKGWLGRYNRNGTLHAISGRLTVTNPAEDGRV